MLLSFGDELCLRVELVYFFLNFFYLVSENLLSSSDVLCISFCVLYADAEEFAYFD